MSDIKSVLKLEKLVFDKIEFRRKGFKNDNQLTHTIEVNFAKNIKEDVYRVILVFKGDKEEEYSFEINLTGYFSFRNEANIDENLQNELIRKNAVSIMMPYMRSEISLLTAQPEMDCIVLPPFNINSLFDGKE